jgi:uncharacterized membrane protein YfcA
VPMLTLLFGVDMRHAMGASLMAVIATSSGAAAAYVKDGLTNIRIGMFLELATTTGAFAGAWLTGMLPASILAVSLGCILIYSAAISHSAFTAIDAAQRIPSQPRFGSAASLRRPKAWCDTRCIIRYRDSRSCSWPAFYLICLASARVR